MIRVEATSGTRFSFPDEVNWMIDDHGRLHVFKAADNGQGKKSIASFATGLWASVCQVSSEDGRAV